MSWFLKKNMFSRIMQLNVSFITTNSTYQFNAMEFLRPHSTRLLLGVKNIAQLFQTLYELYTIFLENMGILLISAS